jgi:hypothetical protein
MRISAISLNGVNGHNQSLALKKKSKGNNSVQTNSAQRINSLYFMPSYQIAFTSIQNSSKLRTLFKYNLPCIYSGVPMIDPKQVSKLLKSGAFEKGAKDVAEILLRYKECYSGMEERVVGIISARSKIHPNDSLKQLLGEIEPIYRRDLRKKQSGIFRNIQEYFKQLPEEYQEKFSLLMTETDKRLNERPVLIPFSSYEFKYKLAKIKDNIANENDIKSKKVMNKLMKESKRLANVTNITTQNNQIRVMGMLDWILRKSVLKNNPALKELIGTSKARLTNKEIIAPFSRKSYIYDLGRIIDTLPDKQMHEKIMNEAFKLPTSNEDFSAYMVKISGESSDKIASRILWPYLASVEHIFPRSEGGADVMANFAGATTRENSIRKSIDFTEQIKRRPNTPYYCQKYVNRLIELYREGVFEKNKISPKYIEEFKDTIYNVSKGQIDLDISKFYE